MLPIRRSVSACIAITLLTNPSLIVAEGPYAVDPANIIERFDATTDSVGHLSLPVTIRNKKYLFLLDTGCARVVYDSSFRTILGTPKSKEKGKTDAGKLELQRFDSPDASLGKLNLKTTSDVVAYDLSSIREWGGIDYYGAIGMEFLKQHIVRIDFDKGEVFFLKSLGQDPGEAFPLSFRHGVICTEALIPGCNREETFVIDTGSDRNSAGTMQLDTYKCLHDSHLTETLFGSEKMMTLSGEIKPTDFRLDTFALGPFVHRNLIFSTSKGFDNKLGLGYLSRFVLTFDFPHRVMYLKKGKYYDLPDGGDRSGFAMSRHTGKTVVCRVAVFGPAWWKGVKTKDVILKIDGNPADQTSLFSLRRLLSMKGKNVKLTLRRGDELIETSLDLPSGPSLTIRLRF